ncbi:MAG: hypothetical protein ACO1N0_10690 [Fluviicola sp.]
MTKQEYCNYLLGLAKLDPLPSGRTDFSDRLFGLFQCFMPKGEGIEKVFEPIENGERYVERIRQIYTVTGEEVTKIFQSGMAPAYFVPPKKTVDESDLIRIGNELLVSFNVFASRTENDEMREALESIQTVKIASEKEEEESDTDILVYESITDWHIENSDSEELIDILDEAFYSIACDYFLGYYFQYPRYENKLGTDFLEPYFQLWKAGYSCSFSENELLIVQS